MQSRRDQVQAHMFLASRMSAAMLRAEPDAPDHPTGRNWRGAVGGLVLAVLIGVGVGIYGLVVPEGDGSWATAGAFVVVEDSSARYLYAGGALHPVLNQASAKLIAGDGMSTHTVSAADLSGTPHGDPFGIVGAPDALPGEGSFYGGSWSACAAPSSTGGADADAKGDAPAGALGLTVGTVAGARGLADGEGVLVASPSGGTQLLYGGRRFRLDAASGAADALSWPAEDAAAVDDALLDTLTAGPDIAVPPVSGRGRPGPKLDGATTRYGQLFTGPGGRRYLLREDGLVELTGLLYDLVRGDPKTQSQAYGGGAVAPGTVGAADLVAHRAPAATAAALAQGLPPTAPRLVAAAGRAVCATAEPRAGKAPAVSVALAPAASVASGAPAVQPGVRAGCLAADRVSVPAGKGVRVRAVSASGGGGSDYLVTDAGVLYPLPTGAAKTLGYDGVAQVGLPASWLELLPAGPALDAAELADGGIVRAATGPATPDGCAAVTAGAGAGDTGRDGRDGRGAPAGKPSGKP
ncbi:type VII secretion protein EccB [Streptomyces sp. NBC_01335]|uniref:type VII secretion protein EccB n=1 Tax=Streptomyces sp. NBC_01335 TaxID=2903828 RepID=UPI002E0DF27C|nr:type VII secretion protein EccB [Streptomyces sp. NBC_01335]